MDLTIRPASVDDHLSVHEIHERLGFAHEGTMRRFGFGDGAWMDAHMMGRIRPSPPPA